MASSSAIPLAASSAVLKESDPVPNDAVSVQGPNFDEPLTLQNLISSYERIGFQANSLGKAIHIVNKMVSVCYLKFFFVENKHLRQRHL
jgi:deoxyhypusine synthase